MIYFLVLVICIIALFWMACFESGKNFSNRGWKKKVDQLPFSSFLISWIKFLRKGNVDTSNILCVFNGYDLLSAGAMVFSVVIWFLYDNVFMWVAVPTQWYRGPIRGLLSVKWLGKRSNSSNIKSTCRLLQLCMYPRVLSLITIHWYPLVAAAGLLECTI